MAEEPHVNAPGEDPEDCVGRVIRDPWDDETQTDWENHTTESAD